MAQSFQLFEPRLRRRNLEDAMADSSMEKLRRAMALALTGGHQQARELCALVMLEVQPVLRRRQLLLRTLLSAMLMSHGFRLASRLMVVLGGRPARFVLHPCEEHPIPAPRCVDGSVYMIDPRWLAQLSPDDPFIRSLCEDLAGDHRVSMRDAGAVRRAPLSPEPV